MAKDMPLYGEREFEEYDEFDRKRRQKLVRANEPFFKEYDGLVARRERMWTFAPQECLAGPDAEGGNPLAGAARSLRREVVRYHELETGREVFCDAGNRIVPGRELSAEDVGRMLEHARDKWGEDGIKVNGGGRFRMQVYEIAYERGMNLGDADFRAYSLHRNREVERAANLSRDEEAGERKDERGRDDGGFGFDGE